MPELPPPSREPLPSGAGNTFGTSIVGAVEHFEKKYGPSAAHVVIARLAPKWRPYVRPNTPALGILGAKRYPCAFVGDLVRGMMQAVGAKDEDVFIRELACAAFDRTVTTVARVVLRSIGTPAAVASRAPDLWPLFNDTGRLKILEIDERHYLSQVTEWTGHDMIVCKLGVECGRRAVERTGVRDVEARREKCVAWGHDQCLTRVRWTP